MTFHSKIFSGLIAAIAVLGLSGTALAASISGAGATFPYPLYAKWAAAYRAETGISLNYQSIGSGGGIAQIRNKTITFGASDMPLSVEVLDDAGLVQFPTVVGGNVPVINVPGIESGQLVLDGPTLADIFLGKIARWNDAAIQMLNPDLDLPDLAIMVVHRSDGSGTTFIWADYLSKVSTQWRARVGAATSVDWPAGIGAKGNEGVAANVARARGAIGYVEYAYAKQGGLSHVRMINRAGVAVEPSLESFQAAAAGADWAQAPGFNLVLTDQSGDQAWPIAGATFILMYKQPSDLEASTIALRFFQWAYAQGDAMATELDYVPMPDSVVELIEAGWAENIQGGGL